MISGGQRIWKRKPILKTMISLEFCLENAGNGGGEEGKTGQSSLMSPSLDWKFSQVVVEHTAGEEVLEGRASFINRRCIQFYSHGLNKSHPQRR